MTGASRKPITAARLERALDRLSVIMDDDAANAPVYLPMFQLLEEELEKMRAMATDLDRVRARARRVRARV